MGLRALRFDDLAGWAEDDHASAFEAFRRSAGLAAGSGPPLRPARPAPSGLGAAFSVAADVPELDRPAARAFFERWFDPFAIVPPDGRSLLTGYFEPVVASSLERSQAFAAPLLARPHDLVTLGAGERPPGLDPMLQAARRTPAGLEPYPDRAAIEDGALGAAARPIAYLADAVEVFIVQVQGSARLRLEDGRTLRAVYAGRNGRPYTSIGRILVEEGHVPLAEMSLGRLTAWLRARPDEGCRLMRRNASYVFFRLDNEGDAAEGPLGGAGVPLTAGRSLAVDRELWSYGLPFWIEGELPSPDGASEPVRRLMIAQDTGSAIVGPARGDFYVGSGPEAGTRAGLLRHPARFVVLSPKVGGLG